MRASEPDGVPPEERPPQASTARFVKALAAYGALALAAAWTLDGMFRWAVWVFLGGLAVKTWAAWRAARLP